MKKDFIHILQIPFTGLGLHNGYRGDDWFKYRINLFKQYTLKSLLNQTCKDFVVWFQFRPEERTNPLTKEFYDYLFELKDFNVIFTFGGITIWDDKYSPAIAKKRLLKSLKMSLPVLEEYLETDKQFVYETLQPSDDLFNLKEVEEIQKQIPAERKVLSHSKGYLLNKQDFKLAEWNPTTNPPFYTIMFPADVFFDPQKHFEYMRGYKSHEDIVRLFNSVRLPDYRYCVMVHEKNISTNWWHPFRGKVYSKAEAKEILKNFGIEFKDIPEIIGKARHWKVKFKFHFLRFLLRIGIYNYVKRIKNFIEQMRLR